MRSIAIQCETIANPFNIANGIHVSININVTVFHFESIVFVPFDGI